jgi:hypothetical protein
MTQTFMVLLMGAALVIGLGAVAISFVLDSVKPRRRDF